MRFLRRSPVAVAAVLVLAALVGIAACTSGGTEVVAGEGDERVLPPEKPGLWTWEYRELDIAVDDRWPLPDELVVCPELVGAQSAVPEGRNGTLSDILGLLKGSLVVEAHELVPPTEALVKVPILYGVPAAYMLADEGLLDGVLLLDGGKAAELVSWSTAFDAVQVLVAESQRGARLHVLTDSLAPSPFVAHEDPREGANAGFSIVFSERPNGEVLPVESCHGVELASELLEFAEELVEAGEAGDVLEVLGWFMDPGTHDDALQLVRARDERRLAERTAEAEERRRASAGPFGEDPERRQLVPGLTPPEAFEGLERVFVELEVPEVWYGFDSRVCWRASPGWSECFAMGPRHGGGIPGLPMEVWVRPGDTVQLWLGPRTDGEGKAVAMADSKVALVAEIPASVWEAWDRRVRVRLSAEAAAGGSLEALEAWAVAGGELAEVLAASEAGPLPMATPGE